MNGQIMMVPHFSLAELTITQVRHCDNQCPSDLLPELSETARLMERIRSALGDVPIIVNSGYRSPEVNKAVGGSPDSAHTRAQAVDFIAPGYGSPYEIARHLADVQDELGIGQLIHEFGAWVHVATRAPSKSVNKTITISGRGVALGIQPV